MLTSIRLSRRDLTIGLLIAALAFALRLVIIVDRAHDPIVSAFAPLPVGADQRTYYNHIAGFEEGAFPPDRYFYQPGMSWFLITSSKLLGTADLAVLRLWIAALASLNCALFAGVITVALNRRAVGALAGILLAIYPVGAFYDTDFVITSQTTELLTLALLGLVMMWKRSAVWLGAVIYGASFGALAVTRFEPITLAPVFGLWLLAVTRDRRVVAQVALAAIVCFLVIGPIAYRNLSNGADYLITPVGAAETYRGNNRDTDGSYGGGLASATTQSDYWEALVRDIRLEPQRFIELELRKLGMSVSPHEPGNNLNYVISGENVSPVLRTIPLDFRILLVLAIFGWFAMARDHHPLRWLLLALFLTMTAAILIIWVEARLRTPIIVFLIPAASYGLVKLWDYLRAHREDISLAALRPLAAPTLASVALVGLGWLAEMNLPRPLTVGELPDSAHPADAIYDNTLRLVGWEIQDEYSRPGILAPFEPYVVSLYWQITQPTDIDYTFSLAFVVDGERVLGVDQPIGQVSYPHVTTSKWEPGIIYVEHVGLTYRSFEGPINISGDLLLGVYPEDAPGDLLTISQRDERYVRLAQPAIIWDEGLLPEDVPLTNTPVMFGNLLTLRGWKYPAEVVTGGEFTVDLAWQTTDAPIDTLHMIGVYLFGAQNQIATQHDGSPRNGSLLTTSLPTNYAFGDTRTLTASVPGVYGVYVGVYSYPDAVRLAVPDEHEAGLPELAYIGEITVSAADAAQNTP